MTMKTRALPLLMLLPAVALSGCVSIGGKVPARLLTLTPSAQAPANAGMTLSRGIAVEVRYPSAPVELANNRVAVRSGPTELAYVKDAQWIDQPAHLFRDLLAEAITTRTGRPALTPRDAALAPGARLSGRLVAFDIDATGHRAEVIYDAAFQRSDNQVETRRFEAQAPVNGAIDENSAGAALNTAANDVAAQVADWIGR